MIGFGNKARNKKTDEALSFSGVMTIDIELWVIANGGVIHPAPGAYRIAFMKGGRSKVIEIFGTGFILTGKNGFSFIPAGL